jgi:hypothetical protein
MSDGVFESDTGLRGVMFLRRFHDNFFASAAVERFALGTQVNGNRNFDLISIRLYIVFVRDISNLFTELMFLASLKEKGPFYMYKIFFFLL